MNNAGNGQYSLPAVNGPRLGTPGLRTLKRKLVNID
jgi:hypothetical protein